MRNKIKEAIEYIKYTRVGYLFLPLFLYALLALSNLLNTLLFNSSNALIIVFLPLSFGLPLLLWAHIRGKDRVISSLKINLPKKEDVLPLILALVFISSASVLLTMLFARDGYLDISIYNTFLASKNKGFFRGIYSIFAFALLPAVAEELFFRGFLRSELEKGGRFTAIIISSLFFSLIEFSFARLPVYFFIGVVLSLIFYVTDSIICTLILRVCYNLFALFALPLLVSIKDVSANAELLIFLLLLVAIGSLILICLQISKLYSSRAKEEPQAAHRSIPWDRLPMIFGDVLLSLPALCSYVLFLITSIICLI